MTSDAPPSPLQRPSVTVDLPDFPKPLQWLEALLKSPEVVSQKQGALLTMIAILIRCHLAYGVIVGSYPGDSQWFAAPLKITIGTLIVGLMCLPSLYIFASLSGADIRPGRTFSHWIDELGWAKRYESNGSDRRPPRR